MKTNFYVCIMAGGSGTRLWPMSLTNLPKQFHAINSNRSLLQETYDRIRDLVKPDHIYISLTSDIVALAKKQLPEILSENYIIEPEGKNTAPAIGLICTHIMKKDPNAIVATISSDHVVLKVDNFQKAIRQTVEFTENNRAYLMTIGIKPTEPHTGYGYIKLGRKFNDSPVYEVDKFVEKPDIDTAQKYLESGDYLWNAGYFTFNVSVLMEHYKNEQAEIYHGLIDIYKSLDTDEENQVIKKIYSNFPKVPIDTAIAEKIKEIAVVPADLGWSDIGSWSSLYELLTNITGKTNISKGHHIGIGDKNCLVYAQDKLVATVGLENIIVIDTPDATLICNKNESQKVKDLIEKLKIDGKHHLL